MPRALITGITGQDGAYLAELLISKGYEVIGTSRDADSADTRHLRRLGIAERVRLESIAVNDFRSVLQTIARVQPDEIYNLAGQSSVGLSFQQPIETLESISQATVNLLEVIRFLGGRIRLVTAGSGECYGDTGQVAANEDTPYRPGSPYAVAKATSRWLVSTYREAYGLHASTAILFNHESPLRSRRFVTAKVANGVARIALDLAAGRTPDPLSLGNLDIQRDWGWAPEYVEALWLMTNQEHPGDYVIATGTSVPLREFVATAFAEAGLDWTVHVRSDPSLLRPNDALVSRADPGRALRQLGWQARTDALGAARLMVRACLANTP